MPKDIHQKLIDLMTKLDYPVDKDGICHGIVMMGERAFFSGTLEKFNKLTDYIENLDVDTLMRRIKNAKNRLKLQPHSILPLSVDEEFTFETLALLDGITLLFCPMHYSKVFCKNVTQLQPEIILPFTFSDNIENKGGFKRKKEYVGMYNLKEFYSHICLLTEVATNFNKNISFCLHTSNHTISICFNSIDQNWVVIDSNDLPTKLFSDTFSIYEYLCTSFGNQEILGLMTSIHYVGSDQDDKRLSFILDQLQANSTFNQIHELTNEKIKLSTTDGIDLLYLAAECGQSDLVEDLLKKGAVAKDDYDGTTLAHIAAQNGHANVIKILAKFYLDLSKKINGINPIVMAALSGHFNVIEAFAQLNVNIFEENAAEIAVFAAQEGHIEILKVLSRYGIDLSKTDINNDTLLHHASENGQADLIPYLKSQGVKLDLPGNNGWVPACLAANCDHINVLQALSNEGLDLSATDNDGCSPAHYAAREGNLNVIKFLIEKNVNVFVEDNTGQTPALLAVGKGDIAILKEILALISDPSKKDKLLNTLIKHAEESNQADVVNFLTDMSSDKVSAKKRSISFLINDTNQEPVQKKSDCRNSALQL